MSPGNPPRFREFSLLVPAAQPVEFISADLYVQFSQGNELGQRCNLVLRGKYHGRYTDRFREPELLELRKSLRQAILLVPVNPRMGGGLVEGNLRRPLRDGVTALAALIQADVDRMHFVEQVGGAPYKQVGQAWRRARVDQRNAVLFRESALVSQLLRLEGIFRQVRAEVYIVRPQAKRRPQHNLVENRSRGINDQLAALGRLHDCAQVPSVDRSHGNRRFPAEKTPRPCGVAIPTPHHVALTFQQMGQQGARRPCTQNEYSHVVSRLYHI